MGEKKETGSGIKEKIQKLNKEVSTLGEAYKSKLLSEGTYLKDKKRIEKKLEILER